MALLADPQGNQTNLDNVVGWLNDHHGLEDRNIKLLLILGDLTSSGNETELGIFNSQIRSLTDDVPWVPLNGNHDMWPQYDRFTAPYQAPVVYSDTFGPERLFDDSLATAV